MLPGADPAMPIGGPGALPLWAAFNV